MEEIKFRVWDKINKRMCKVVSMSSGCDSRGTWGWFVTIEWLAEAPREYHLKNPSNPKGLYFKQEKRDPSDIVLLLYIGLKDKKRTKKYPEGQEIYEGDILQGEMKIKYPDSTEVHKPIFKVVYEEYDTAFSAYDILNKCCVKLNAVDCEVIGNIHSNPELLGGAK